MVRKVNISGSDVKDSKEATQGFPVIPAGWYNGTIFDVAVKEFKQKGKHPGDEYYNVQLRVSEGDYAKRTLFVIVPLFPKWNPTEKAPSGFPTQFIPFFEALGYELEGEFEIPDPEDLAGQEITFKVSVKPDTYAREQKGETGAMRNEVSNFREYDPDDDPSPKAEAQAESKPKPKAKSKSKGKGGFDL